MAGVLQAPRRQRARQRLARGRQLRAARPRLLR